jgi:hypothetical protein
MVEDWGGWVIFALSAPKKRNTVRNTLRITLRSFRITHFSDGDKEALLGLNPIGWLNDLALTFALLATAST